MEHATAPVTIILGGRLLTLVFNARAWRLIIEKTGFNYLAEQKRASDAIPADASDVDRQRIYADHIGESLRNLLEDSLKLPQVLWSITQNPGNGENGQRPTIEFIEDYMMLDGASIKKIGEAMKASFESGLSGEAQGNAPAAATSTTTGSTSGPSDAAASV